MSRGALTDQEAFLVFFFIPPVYNTFSLPLIHQGGAKHDALIPATKVFWSVSMLPVSG